MRLFLLLALCWSTPFLGTAWKASAKENSGPIYLEEPEPFPPPKVVRQRLVKEKYRSETLRLEREVNRLSDDSLVNHGRYAEFYRDSKPYCEGQYVDGVATGQWKYWFPNGQLCKTISFEKGLADGSWEVFRQDGSRIASKHYEKGNRVGEWTFYFEDGEQPRLEIHYLNGLKEGLRTTYYENGQVRQRVTMKKNLLHGTLTEWDESGQKITQGEFIDGKLQGKFERWKSKVTKPSTESKPENNAAQDSASEVPSPASDPTPAADSTSD